MATISESLATAIAHHQAGRIDEAEQIYRQIVAIEPNNARAWSLLGVIEHQRGQSDIAARHIARAVALSPNDAESHNNLGIVLQQQGMVDEARHCFQRALEIRPSSASANYNLGNVLFAQKRHDEAARCYLRAIELNAGYVEAYNNLGNVLQARGKLDEAIECYRRALHCKPDYPEAQHNLGRALYEQTDTDGAIASYRRALQLMPTFAEVHYSLGRALHDRHEFDEATTCYRRAVELHPSYSEAWNDLGSVLADLGRFDEAATCYFRAIKLSPEYAAAHSNLGTVYNQQGRFEEAIACHRRALELRPEFAEAHHNLGSAYFAQGRFDEAARCYRRAVEQRSDFAEAHKNLSQVWLLNADYERGWPEYEWRWKTGELPDRRFDQPRWDGQPLNGQTILLHAEQGLGDTIQFVRYASLVKSYGAAVVVECPKPLMRLLASCPGIDRLIGSGEELPPFDVQAPLLSLPGFFKTTLETIPANVPYLFADSGLVELWRLRLASLLGNWKRVGSQVAQGLSDLPFLIGINWHGREGQGAFRQRDIPLALFASLAQIPGVRLISLQKGSRVGSAHHITSDSGVVGEAHPTILDLGEDVDTTSGAFMDTAAIMMNLDLVITSDTAIPHLAGALGVPVWLALPYVPDWRWLLDRSDSPWYPTMRLFRQKSPGDWPGVFDEIRAALRAAMS